MTLPDDEFFAREIERALIGCGFRALVQDGFRVVVRRETDGFPYGNARDADFEDGAIGTVQIGCCDSYECPRDCDGRHASLSVGFRYGTRASRAAWWAVKGACAVLRLPILPMVEEED